MQTIREVCALLELPESTLRLYRDEFDDFIPCAGEGRKRRYADEGVETLRRIVAWKREGWTSGRIRDELARERTPRERKRRRTNEERLDEAILLLTAQTGEIALLRAEIRALRERVEGFAAAARVDAPPRYEDALAAVFERE